MIFKYHYIFKNKKILKTKELIIIMANTTKKGVLYFDGKVTRVLNPDFLENHSDWLTNGAPKGAGMIVDVNTDVEVNDYVDSNGKIDTLGRHKERKYKEIPAMRYQHEVAGLEVDGIKIKTDRESRATLNEVALSAMLNEKYTCEWKTDNGFITLNRDQIINIVKAVRAYIQECFDREKELMELTKKATTAEAIMNLNWEKDAK